MCFGIISCRDRNLSSLSVGYDHYDTDVCVIIISDYASNNFNRFKVTTEENCKGIIKLMLNCIDCFRGKLGMEYYEEFYDSESCSCIVIRNSVHDKIELTIIGPPEKDRNTYVYNKTIDYNLNEAQALGIIHAMYKVIDFYRKNRHG